jgi:glycosyltransferase involved in cell wall biosynthesis
MAHDLGVANDVLCLHRLAPRELAACYRLARLAVNPSLAEGGMPFTFAEAVSVGTPVVMADLAVTREVLVQPELRARTLFDPYDATAMADCIEAALADRAGLFSLQRRFFDDSLAPRTWDTVVSEHVAVLDRIARPADSLART